MRPAKPYSYPGIDADIRRLGGLLALGLRTVGWQPREPTAILNLACGRADETGILVHHLAPFARSLFYLGLDIRDPEIAEARARWIPSAPPGHQIDFRAGDASRTDLMQQLPQLDFIFIRHQNFWNDAPLWTRLFEHALAHLKPDGILAITSYFEYEHQLALACFRQLGANLTANLPHPQSRPLGDAPGKSVDRHLAFFTKAQR